MRFFACGDASYSNTTMDSDDGNNADDDDARLI